MPTWGFSFLPGQLILICEQKKILGPARRGSICKVLPDGQTSTFVH